MRSMKEDAAPDERIGNDPLPKSARQLLLEEIVSLQRQVYLLEKKLNEMDAKDLAFYHRPPTR